MWSISSFIFEQFQNLLIGRPKSNRRLKRLELKVNGKTKRDHEEIENWALLKKSSKLADADFLESADEIVKLGFKLRTELLNKFENKLLLSKVKILIHCPNEKISVGYESIFKNIFKAFSHLGVKVKLLFWEETRASEILKEFKPNILFSLNDRAYIKNLDWEAIDAYRKENSLKIGLSVCERMHCHSGETLEGIIERGKNLRVDFYHSLWDQEYIDSNEDYRKYLELGYSIIPWEFGANIFDYYPVPQVDRDLDYVFLASTNRNKRPRYHEYLSKVFRNFYGFYDGPGWLDYRGNTDFSRDKFLYARTRIGINLHLQKQIDTAYDMNERTYQLAACGTPQLVDNAQLVLEKFRKESLFIAKTPKEYYELFEYALNSPQICREKAKMALEDIYNGQTLIHKAFEFVKNLEKVL